MTREDMRREVSRVRRANLRDSYEFALGLAEEYAERTGETVQVVMGRGGSIAPRTRIHVHGIESTKHVEMAQRELGRRFRLLKEVTA